MSSAEYRSIEFLSMKEILQLFGKSPRLPTTVVSDSCHSGACLEIGNAQEYSNLRIIAACSSEQEAPVRRLLNYLTGGICLPDVRPCQLRLNYSHCSVLQFDNPS